MKTFIQFFLAVFLLIFLPFAKTSSSYPASGCGTMCYAQMRGFCPTCGLMTGPSMMPWGMPSPWWWGTGPMMYSNFYMPGPWSYGPRMTPGMMPGIMPNYYPGGGMMFAAKPNLYINGQVGTEVSVKVSFVEEGSNWLAAVPVHGVQGWKATLAERNKLKTDQGTYGYLYSDYRFYGKNLQDQEGFCTERKNVIEKMAFTLKNAGFNGREVADFMEYWSVKLPPAKKFCVYPQDERQLDAVAKLEITPKPAAVKRVLFMVQVEDALNSSGQKFTAAPKRVWNPEPTRVPASGGMVVHEWGVGFFAAKSR